MRDKDEDTVVTFGVDDTTKAAGMRSYDVKGTHITFQTKDGQRSTYTTGFQENIAHTAAAAAESMQFTMDVLGILAGTDGDMMKQMIDFWMSDRASDVDPSLEKLGVEPRRRLKCCAHIILCIDEAIEKVLKDHELRIGLSKLLEVQSTRFNIAGRGASILTLGQIAIAKMLSPSHAKDTISLFESFSAFMKKSDTKNDFKGSLPLLSFLFFDFSGLYDLILFCDPLHVIATFFKGFISNRFGRKASSAALFLENRSLMKEFFVEQVDEHSNLLWLACHAYLNNEWFAKCSTMYADVADTITFPLMEILGIDQFKDVKNINRSWKGVKQFFKEKLPELETRSVDLSQETTGVSRMHAKIYDEIVTAIRRQLAVMPFFTDEDGEGDDITEELMKWAPLTNLGCESKMGWLDNRIKVSGGSTTVHTLSHKSIVAHNGLLSADEFQDLSPEEKLVLWRFGRNSDTAKTVKSKWDDFHNRVQQACTATSYAMHPTHATHAHYIHTHTHTHISACTQAKVLAEEARKKFKKKKASRLVGLLEKCMQHGGPVTDKNVGILDGLTTDQLKLEISVLKQTVSETVRSKFKVTVEGGPNYFETYPDEVLRSTISGVTCPSSKVDQSVEALLLGIEPASEFIGRKVKKDFEGDLYSGVVDATYLEVDDGRVTTLYVVRYDDGDEEDYNEDELRSILLPIEDNEEDSEEVTLSVEQLLVASEYIGRKVEKDFDGETYAGEVKEYYPLEDGGRVKTMYVVQYEDNDIGDVDEDELQSILLPV